MKRNRERISITEHTVFDELSDEQIDELTYMFNLSPNFELGDGVEAYFFHHCDTLEEFINYLDTMCHSNNSFKGTQWEPVAEYYK